MQMLTRLVQAWTGAIPKESLRNQFHLDYLIHPVKRHLAKWYLQWLKHQGTLVIGITGSFGKTTTKEILYSMLSKSEPTIRTTANIDPVYNIPHTILRTPPTTKYLILEMGIEYPGEMDFYMWMAPADIAIITGIGITHTKFLKNPETIYFEKAKITKYAKYIVDYAKVKPDFKNSFKIAADVAAHLGLSQKQIDQGSQTYTAPPHRLRTLNPASDVIIIDDAYNANPTAVELAIETLVSTSKRGKRTPVLVLGQMNELGDYEESAHKEIGTLVAHHKIKHLFTIGPATKHIITSAKTGQMCNSLEELAKNLQPFLNAKYVILVKGSRSWHLEELVEKITE